MNFFNKKAVELSKDAPKVLSVGQCGCDHRTIASVFKDRLGADVVGASSLAEASRSLETSTFQLVLMNRLLDLDGSSGLDCIRRIKANPTLSQTPVMLVSNYPDAQREAEELGALPGFGKSNLRSDEVLHRLKEILQAHTKD